MTAEVVRREDSAQWKAQSRDVGRGKYCFQRSKAESKVVRGRAAGVFQEGGGAAWSPQSVEKGKLIDGEKTLLGDKWGKWSRVVGSKHEHP